ncbi:MAG: hypothetical protein RRA92_11065 [Gemmatimonadota bacterium]|nr:hypothetical protein [Gemmatimonadota bacterium]
MRPPTRPGRAGRPPARLAARFAAVLAVCAATAVRPDAARAQYAIVLPAGDSLRFELPEVRRMLDTTRALRRNLEEDPRVLYRIGFRDPVPAEAPAAAWPWHAVEPASDSVVDLQMPGNLREASRAYENYAVIRMRTIRSRDPDAPCDSLVAWESEALSAFADGWIVARTLFGGPPYPPLDAVPFARAAGHLEALAAEGRSRAVGACAAAWVEAHPEAVQAWLEWREDRGLAGPGEAAGPGDDGTPDAPAGDPGDATGAPVVPRWEG